MNPAFALSFSATGISLHHQSDGDWFSIGTVSLDASDLEAQIKALHEKGFALETDLSCKVILPPDQIRYLSVQTEGLSAEERDQKIYDALAQATPYDVSELAFDTAPRGPETCIAAVARQTLQEAEAFATQHGFIPVRFSADARAQDFPKEPEFDLSAPALSVSPSVASAVDPVITQDGAAVPEDTAIPQTPDTPEETGVPEETAVLDVTNAPNEPDFSEVPDTDEDPQTSGPAVHAIADAEAPDVFRSPNPLAAAAGLSESTWVLGLKGYAIPAVAAVVCVGVAIAAWSVLGPEPDTTEDELAASEALATPVPSDESVQLESDTQATVLLAEPGIATEENPVDTPPEATTETSAEEQPELTPTDAAILEALQVPPTPVEPIASDPEALEDAEAVAGLGLTAPIAPDMPLPVEPGDLYLASIDKRNLSTDAVALPPVSSFDTELPFIQPASLGDAAADFDLDERGLVTPTPEGTLNPEGILVFLGPPPSVPPDAPVRFEKEPGVEEEEDQRLAGLRPRLRPGDLIEQFERQQLGGRSLEELSVLRPKLRPESVQASPQIDETPTALAVVRVPRPNARPAGLAAAAARVASANTTNLGSTAAVDQNSDEAGSFEAKAVAPTIPSTASVARQATIDNAINLRRLNLIGVYGTPANRRALVRLPSGRYKKLKVGDRIDGGRVIAISESELRYEKRGRNLTLKMPRG